VLPWVLLLAVACWAAGPARLAHTHAGHHPGDACKPAAAEHHGEAGDTHEANESDHEDAHGDDSHDGHDDAPRPGGCAVCTLLAHFIADVATAAAALARADLAIADTRPARRPPPPSPYGLLPPSRAPPAPPA
jgi:hypothetical protein